jgi:hypothetical protein
MLAICGWFLCSCAWGQSEVAPIPLGDLARTLRKKEPPAPSRTVIDNDNLSQVMDEVTSQRSTRTSLLYSFDGAGRTFQVSSPDVTCSLSFNANAASLLSRPYVPIDLPQEELRKLDGPATISEDGLQVSVFNGTDWRIEEITVGLTIVRHASPPAGYYGSGKLVPAVSETAVVAAKHSDITTLHRLKADALPAATTIFRTPLTVPLGPDEDWHWAIIQAKGVPPAKLPVVPMP